MFIKIPREFYRASRYRYKAKYKILDSRNIEVSLNYIDEVLGYPDRGYFVFSPSGTVINDSISNRINSNYRPQIKTDIINWLRINKPELFNITKTKPKHRSKKNMQYSKNKLGNVVYKRIKPKSYYHIVEKLKDGSSKLSRSSLTGLLPLIKSGLTAGNSTSVEISFVDVSGE